MRTYRPIACALFAAVGLLAAGCHTTDTSASDGSGSEIAASVVSGALNNSAGSSVADSRQLPRPEREFWRPLLDALRPVSEAFAAKWSCQGGNLQPKFAGDKGNPYTYTPISCTVTWGNGKTSSVTWSGTFSLNYSKECDALHPWIGNQIAGCGVTRTTAAGGNTRTLTGPAGNSYAVVHDTHGATSGWDSSVTPAPSDSGVVATCGASGCKEGGTLVISGSHLTGNVTSGGKTSKLWDHTVSTSAGGLTIASSGANREVSGTVIVQHNLAKFTTKTTFNQVKYSDPSCCFPTSGSITTAFTGGPHVGKTESLAFNGACGDATLTASDGTTSTLVLQHCL